METITGVGGAESVELDIQDGVMTLVVTAVHSNGKTEGNTNPADRTSPGSVSESHRELAGATRGHARGRKETGQLYIIPEQGIRVYMKDREACRSSIKIGRYPWQGRAGVSPVAGRLDIVVRCRAG